MKSIVGRSSNLFNWKKKQPTSLSWLQGNLPSLNNKPMSFWDEVNGEVHQHWIHLNSPWETLKTPDIMEETKEYDTTKPTKEDEKKEEE